jgi:hypothetical protein
MMLCASVDVGISIILGSIGYVVSLLCWIIAHGDDPHLADNPSLSMNPLGGDENNEVSGSEGGFAV